MAKKCPLCKERNKSDAEFCRACGTSLPDLDRSLPARGALVAVQWFCESYPGFFHPKVLIWSIIVGLVGIMGVCLGKELGAFFTLLVGGSGLVVYWTACVWMVTGHFCWPSEGMADFMTHQWWAFAVIFAVLWPLGLAIAGLLCVAIMG